MRRASASIVAVMCLMGWASGPTRAEPAASRPAGEVAPPCWDDCPATPTADGPSRTCPRANGYRGIWYYNQKTGDEYQYKYSGGLGTYCADHIPLAVHAPQAGKTFFVYGGVPAGIDTTSEKQNLLIMVSCYDHKTGMVP
ncbi:MAG TPA: hypothetical protein VLM89_04955, partial [Phycisphaerae bacterium]|nr:hypothetical protein [Phycisphaerae bacterium]